MEEIIICIEGGHGSKTIGKRTPILDDGSFMLENEFNKAVVNYLDIELQRCGFKTLLVAEGDSDVPLQTRTDLANNTVKNKYNKPADFYLSVHANAFKGIWGDHGGIETYVYTGTDAETIKMGEIIHKHLLKGTPLRDRGLKKSDFYVLKNTKMSAVLVECGFMDNKEEALLLMSDKYRRECATELAQAICEIYDVEYKEEEQMEEIVVIPQWKKDGELYLREMGYTTSIHNPEDNIDFGTLGTILKRFNQKVIDSASVVIKQQ